MTNEEIVAKLLGINPVASNEETKAPETKNGIFRMLSAKGKGYWLARYKDQERVFYDGSYGTTVSAKNCAKEWYDTVSLGPKKAKQIKQAESILDWLDEKVEKFGSENVEEIKSKVIETFCG